MRTAEYSGRRRRARRPHPSEYEVRHGFGYTVFKHESHELSQEVTMFMARDEPIKLTQIRIVNRSGQNRRLSLLLLPAVGPRRFARRSRRRNCD